MKIYTSYFGLFKQFPLNCVPISIALYSPDWYLGRRCYDKLAPTPSILSEWFENEDKDLYVRRYNEEILQPLSQVSVVNDLMVLAQQPEPNEFLEEAVPKDADRDILLLCYEPPSAFCHRHIVAQWLTSAGYVCKEYSEMTLTPKRPKPKILF